LDVLPVHRLSEDIELSMFTTVTDLEEITEWESTKDMEESTEWKSTKGLVESTELESTKALEDVVSTTANSDSSNHQKILIYTQGRLDL
jgi:hypothetical protein